MEDTLQIISDLESGSIHPKKSIHFARNLVWYPVLSPDSVWRIDGIGDNQDSNIYLEMVRLHMMLELLPFLLDVKMLS